MRSGDGSKRTRGHGRTRRVDTATFMVVAKGNTVGGGKVDTVREFEDQKDNYRREKKNRCSRGVRGGGYADALDDLSRQLGVMGRPWWPEFGRE